MPRKLVLLVCLVSMMIATSGCRDTVWIYSHPTGADLRVDNHPYGKVPETGVPVDVHWFTFSQHDVELRWPGDVVMHTHLEKGFGAPEHPEYLVMDGVLVFSSIFFPIMIIPGITAICVNCYGPEGQQHFYAPAPVPGTPAQKPHSKDGRTEETPVP